MTLVTAQLALGDSRDPVRCFDRIDAVLCCAREVPLALDKPGHHLRLYDDVAIESKALKTAYEFLTEHLAAGHLVLVYCGQGVSRSAAVLCGYLALQDRVAPQAVLESIQRLRPQVRLSKNTFQSIERYVSESRDLTK